MKRASYLIVLFMSLFFLVSCSDSKAKTVEEYISYSSAYKYDATYDAYIISFDLNTTLGDRVAIESFNDEVYDVLQLGLETDKPVIFRGWWREQGLTGSLLYFDVETFNQDWGVFRSIDTYQYADAWQTISKFGQYLSSNSGIKDDSLSETMFYLFMESK